MSSILLFVLIIILCVPSAIRKAHWYEKVDEFVRRRHGGEQ